jgi:hypothetical protein
MQVVQTMLGKINGKVALVTDEDGTVCAFLLILDGSAEGRVGLASWDELVAADPGLLAEDIVLDHPAVRAAAF